ncbi:MAG: hypothetical protein ACAH07_05745 [Methylophilaceae bacterium]|nr:hypothetical protein [Methyloradius sp.]
MAFNKLQQLGIACSILWIIGITPYYSHLELQTIEKVGAEQYTQCMNAPDARVDFCNRQDDIYKASFNDDQLVSNAAYHSLFQVAVAWLIGFGIFTLYRRIKSFRTEAKNK